MVLSGMPLSIKRGLINIYAGMTHVNRNYLKANQGIWPPSSKGALERSFNPGSGDM